MQVDHGKTTLVDKLLDACAENIDNDDGGDRAMDSLDLERERGILLAIFSAFDRSTANRTRELLSTSAGITIMSKVTSMTWKGVKLNIVDTPGHADFGGVWPSQVHSMP